MSWVVNSIKSALGVGAAAPPAVADKGDEGTAQGPPACYPDDVAFDENPCLSCNQPCSTHKQIPDYLKIDMEDPLLGSMKPYKRHVLFQTPDKRPTNWAPKLDEQEGTLAFELSAGAKAAGKGLGYRVIVTAVDDDAQQQAAAAVPLLATDEVLVLPDMVALGPLTVDNARSGIEKFLTTGEAPEGASLRQLAPWTPLGEASPEESPDGQQPGGPACWAACILVCSHKLRDKRCGVAGPLIMEELRAECTRRGVQGRVAVMGCSHVGGHKFAGNLIVYSAAGGHWYGRVKPCHSEAIIGTHLVEGKVIKELWRGRMDV